MRAKRKVGKNRKYQACMELKKELDTLRKREQKLLAAYDRSLGDNLKESSVKGHYRERHWVKKHVRKVRPRKLSEKMFK